VAQVFSRMNRLLEIHLIGLVSSSKLGPRIGRGEKERGEFLSGSATKEKVRAGQAR